MDVHENNGNLNAGIVSDTAQLQLRSLKWFMVYFTSTEFYSLIQVFMTLTLFQIHRWFQKVLQIVFLVKFL